jgi:hypothetical protein
MVVPTAAGDSRKFHSGTFKDKSKPKDIRTSNITAAKGGLTGRCAFLGCFLNSTVNMLLKLKTISQNLTFTHY